MNLSEHLLVDGLVFENTKRIYNARLEIRLSLKLKFAVMLISINQDSVESVEESCISVTIWPRLRLNHSFLDNGELR